ncbi:hypothetical protein CJO75_19400 (plasmid) [Ralstonia solanacearum]|nr:hypothetical protein CJO75_19400 [Ralstonia solanacearum]
MLATLSNRVAGLPGHDFPLSNLWMPSAIASSECRSMRHPVRVWSAPVAYCNSSLRRPAAQACGNWLFNRPGL